jgi:lipase chaperone LimK
MLYTEGTDEAKHLLDRLYTLKRQRETNLEKYKEYKHKFVDIQAENEVREAKCMEEI